jgi:hypothetical protein
VEVRVADAGFTDAYVGAVPADIVLLVGIFGNIGDADLAGTIAAAPQLCAPGATLIWSRGCEGADRNDVVRERFVAAGFTEIDHAVFDGSDPRPAIGVVRHEGPAPPLEPGRRLFTFRR